MRKASSAMAPRLLLAAALLALALPAAASAHARLLATSPADGSVLLRAPRQVTVTFDDTVRLGRGNAAVANDDGRSVLGAAVRVAGRAVRFPLRSGLPDGAYTVRWSIVSEDGHREEGVLAFAVGAGAARPVPALTASTGSQLLEAVLKAVYLLGALGGAGTAAFWLVGRAVLTGAAAHRLREAVAPQLFACLFAAFVGAGGLAQAAASGTRYALAFDVASIVSGLGAAAAALGARRPALVAVSAALAATLPAAAALGGHALDPGRLRLAELPVDLLHLGAASVWFGGVLALLCVLPRATASPAARQAVARRFSNVALGSVVLLAATGVARALAELSSVGQLWSTSYGRLLIAKTALFVPLVAIGGLNRSLVEGGYGRLRRALRLELALLVAILAIAAFLTLQRPGVAAPRPAASHRSGARESTAHPRTPPARRAHPAPAAPG